MPKRECPDKNSECRLFPRCFADKHHPDWPRKDYKTPLEKEFRETRSIGNYICRAAHEAIHREDPPEKPSVEEMRLFLGHITMPEEAA